MLIVAFLSMYEIQQNLENPFDGSGVDDIRIIDESREIIFTLDYLELEIHEKIDYNTMKIENLDCEILES